MRLVTDPENKEASCRAWTSMTSLSPGTGRSSLPCGTSPCLTVTTTSRQTPSWSMGRRTCQGRPHGCQNWTSAYSKKTSGAFWPLKAPVTITCTFAKRHSLLECMTSSGAALQSSVKQNLVLFATTSPIETGVSSKKTTSTGFFFILWHLRNLVSLSGSFRACRSVLLNTYRPRSSLTKLSKACRIRVNMHTSPLTMDLYVSILFLTVSKISGEHTGLRSTFVRSVGNPQALGCANIRVRTA